MNVSLLISGGVDSAVATHLLCEQGISPDLFYIRIGMDDEDLSCTAEEDIEMSRAIARRYGLRIEVVDLQREYWESVIGYVTDRTKRGLTPNPDVMCNKLIKFGAFEEKVGKHYDFTATGHYAQVLRETVGGREEIFLGTSPDPVKDQTDFLSQLSERQVRKLILPIGHLEKAEVRAIAERQHLAPARRRDSQGICFLGKISYTELLRKLLGEQEGDIVELGSGRKVGRHKGYWFHTIGQRKGLKLGGGPWFVVKKDIRRNIVYVCHENINLYEETDKICLKDFHFITADPWQGAAACDILFKIRHTEPPRPGVLLREEEGFAIRCQEPPKGIAPGQFGVVYTRDGRICAGSGEICIQ